MLQGIKFFALTYSSIAFAFILQPGYVTAANIKYEFTVDFPPLVFEQPLLGQRGNGYLIFDDASSPVLSRTPEDIQLDYFEIEQLQFSLLGQTFTEEDDISTGQFPYRFPLVALNDNRLQGLNYAVNRRNPAGLGFGFRETNDDKEFVPVSDGVFSGGVGAQAFRDGFNSNNDGTAIGTSAEDGLSTGRVTFRRVPLHDDIIGVVYSLSLGLSLFVLKNRRKSI